MTDAQILQIFGLGLSAIGLAWIIDHKGYKKTLKDILLNRGVLLVMGLFALTVGYLIVAVYQTYSTLIVVLGWIALLKGLAIIIAPSIWKDLYTAFAQIKKYLTIMPWIVLLVGLAALYFGFIAG